MKKKILIVVTSFIFVLLLYFLFWPVPLDPVSITPMEMPDLTGDFKPNTDLSEVQLLGEGSCYAPEDVAFDNEGRLYSGMIETGEIMRFQLDGSNPEVFAMTNGKPAGLGFDENGNLIVADVEKGLLSINQAGEITVLVDEYEGEKLHMINDLDFDAEGNIYFSQTSTKYHVDQMFYDIMEYRPNGRLFLYDPVTKETKVLMEDLYFANGIAVSFDSSYVLVAETNAARITRYWLKGEKQGTRDVFTENLPGFPDNIDSNGRDTYWVAMVDGPDERENYDALLPYGFLRKIIIRIPSWITQSKSAGGYAFVIGFDEAGAVSYNLQDPKGVAYNNITSATEYEGKLYLGTNNITLDGIGWLEIPMKEIK